MHDIHMAAVSKEFSQCWQAAGIHIQNQAQGPLQRQTASIELIHGEVRFEKATCMRNHAGLMSAAARKTGFGTQDRVFILATSCF
jgi:hypothetical protein